MRGKSEDCPENKGNATDREIVGSNKTRNLGLKPFVFMQQLSLAVFNTKPSC